jgi:hypothetical protein
MQKGGMAVRSRLSIVLLLGFVVVWSVTWADDDSSRASPPMPAVVPEKVPLTAGPPIIERACAGTTRPGWARIDDQADPASPCKTNDPKNPYNVWLIEKLDDRPRGSTVEICRVPVVPMRWYMAQSKWDGTRCGHPKERGPDNIMVIRRAH